MNITVEDTPVTVALKLRIQQLERENYALKFEKGIAPHWPVTAELGELQPVPFEDSKVEVRRIASWAMKRDPFTFKLHMIGRTYGRDKNLAMEYFHEEPHFFSEHFQAHVFGELHKKFLYEVGKIVKL